MTATTSTQPTTDTTTPLLECRDVSVSFGGVVAVDGISLVVHPGEILGLVGPNGSGKSTLLNAMTGLVGAAGNVWVDGKKIPLGRPGVIVRHGVYRTFQTPQVDPELTCLENVLVGSPNMAARRTFATWINRPTMWRHEHERWDDATRALRRVGLLEKANARASGLSYGERRHLEIARALSAEPRLLLMDEPAAGLSSVETQRLAELLKSFAAEHLTVLVVEHKIAFLEEICDRIVVLELGRRIAEGTPAEVFADPAVIAAYLGEAR